jgi:hypothetical protein
VQVLVCGGSDCRKAEGHTALRDALADAGEAEVRIVGCQKICKGPVAGVEVGGRLEWFKRLRGPKSRRALLRLVHLGAPLPDRLRKRRVAKRSGRLRGRARPGPG